MLLFVPVANSQQLSINFHLQTIPFLFFSTLRVVFLITQIVAI